jgi:hypothetical protein
MNFKDRLYNYEPTPPEQVWKNISEELNQNDGKVRPLSSGRKKSKIYLYFASAAASVLIVLAGFIFLNKPSKHQLSDSSNIAKQSNLSAKKIQDSIKLNNKILDQIISSSEDKNLLALNYEYSLKGRKYLTVAGPEGNPVKISPKAATLIESTDNGFPPKPVWSKKVDKWQQIMLSSTLSPTSTNLLDIFQASVSNDSE